jgi:hypothetical protein
MKTKKVVFRMCAAVLGVVLLATVLGAKASGQCGYSAGATVALSKLQSRSWEEAAKSGPASFVRGSAGAPAGSGIVGFWKVTFVAQGNDGIPDGVIIDFGFSQWHSDGTEILNSSRPPATSNFCLGVWKKRGRASYQLNHFALSSDPNGNLIGPANIREAVVLDRTGNSYSGSFSIDQFDLSGNTLAHITGQVTATRITVDSQP